MQFQLLSFKPLFKHCSYQQTTQLLAALCLVLISPMSSSCELTDNEASFEPCWYISQGAGITHVDPEGTAGGWRTTDDEDTGFSIKLGYQFKPQWFAEISYTDAGEATLTNFDPEITGNPGIEYKIPAAFAGYWLRPPSQRLNFYGKLGMSAIDNEATDSRVPFDKQSTIQVAFGAGLRWRFLENWFVDFEHVSYDKDASYTGLSIGAFLGN